MNLSFKRPSFKRPRLLRLLPGVAMVSGLLLVLNGSGLFHAAAALAQTAMNAAPVPANPDYAGGDEQIATAAQADMLTVMARRRTALDAREAELKMQADILAATEKRVDAKIAQLQSVQDKITALLGQRDDAQKVQIAALIKTYGPESMKAGAAAAIFNTMPDNVLIPVAQGMRPGDLGKILAAMSPDAAQKLTVKLANRLALPETADAPVQTASATPASAAPTATPNEQKQP